MAQNTATLLISCPDKTGIIASVSQFLFSHGANILDSSQHTTDPENGLFFMRLVFHLEGLDLSHSQFENAFEKVLAIPFEMKWKIHYADTKQRMAIMISKYDHCLMELLWKWKSNELDADLPLIISNHNDLAETVSNFNIPFHVFEVTKANKLTVEEEMLALLAEHQVDFIVLARYMQILSPNFVSAYRHNIINIHHSFLPAFVGANPYRNAYQRGVKLIGATAHYVTNDLDEGPIIEQDVARVSHKEEVPDLMRIGRDIERTVLAKAVQAHLQNRVIVYKNKTIVF